MFLGWRELQNAKGRFFLILLVVFMIALLVQLLSGLTAGLNSQNISAIKNLDAQKIVFSTQGGEENSFTNSRITQNEFAEWKRVNDDEAYPLGIVTTNAKNADIQVPVTVFGTPPSQENHSSKVLGAGGLVLSEPAAENLNATVGDVVTLGSKEYPVTDIQGSDYYAHTPVIWGDSELWKDLSRSTETDDIGTVVVVSGDGFVQDTDVLRAVTLKESLNAIGSYKSENGSLQLMRAFLFVIAALVVSAFFTVWTIQRSHDIAILKALGASNNKLLTDALGQAGIILTLGVLLGTECAGGIGILAQNNGIPFIMTTSTLLLPALALFTLGSAGAYLAVRRIISVDPLIALGSTR